jgi:hypothetical protein
MGADTTRNFTVREKSLFRAQLFDTPVRCQRSRCLLPPVRSQIQWQGLLAFTSCSPLQPQRRPVPLTNTSLAVARRPCTCIPVIFVSTIVSSTSAVWRSRCRNKTQISDAYLAPKREELLAGTRRVEKLPMRHIYEYT